MTECSSLEIHKTKLTEQTKVRIDKISEIENYFHQEINQTKLCSKKLSKYVAAFDYTDKVLLVLSATSSGVSFIPFTSVVGAPVGIPSFSLTIEIIKNLLSITRNKNKRHDKILMLAKSKLNSIETLISQALIDMEISHKEFVTIFKEEDKYKRMKENVRNVSEKLERKT